MMIIIIKASTDYLRCSMSVRYIYIVTMWSLSCKGYGLGIVGLATCTIPTSWITSVIIYTNSFRGYFATFCFLIADSINITNPCTAYWLVSNISNNISSFYTSLLRPSWAIGPFNFIWWYKLTIKTLIIRKDYRDSGVVEYWAVGRRTTKSWHINSEICGWLRNNCSMVITCCPSTNQIYHSIWWVSTTDFSSNRPNIWFIRCKIKSWEHYNYCYGYLYWWYMVIRRFNKKNDSFKYLIFPIITTPFLTFG